MTTKKSGITTEKIGLKIKEIEKQLVNHDCHMGEEDGCICLEARGKLSELKQQFINDQKANAQDID